MMSASSMLIRRTDDLINRLGSSYTSGSVTPHLTDSPNQTENQLVPEISSSSPTFMSPTFAAITTITNLIPLPSLLWSSPKIPAPYPSPSSSPIALETDLAFVGGASSLPVPKAKFGSYVQREKQLAKLKLRLDQEGHLKSSGLTDRVSTLRRYRTGILEL